MRILRLDLETGEGLDLHPYVTVLGGLDPVLQRRVIDQLSGIARGDVDGMRGLVEAHGMLIEIDEARIASLGLPAEADVVVEADQLPGARLLQTDAPENEHHRALREKVATVEHELERITTEISRVSTEIARQTDELDDARRSLDEFAVTAHESAVRTAAEAEELVRRRLEADGGADVVAEAAPPESAADRERQQLATELAEQRRRHQDLEAMLDEERLGLLQLLEQLEAERNMLEALRAEQAATLATPEPEPESEPEPEPAGPDPADIAAVDAAIREIVAGPPEAPMVQSLPAAALADQVAAHRQRQREYERDLVERGMDPGAIRERLEYARRAESEAAEAARPKTVSPEDEAEIERLHDIVIENVDKRESRRSGKEATRLYEEANIKLDEVLERYGFPTYASFIMGRTAPSIDLESKRRHEEAKALIESLQRELDDLAKAIDEDPHGRMLRAEREQLWAAAAELLGTVPDDIERALREHKVPARAEFDAPDRLRDLMRRLGVDTSEAGTTGRLLEIADAWLTDATAASAPPDPYEPYPSDPHAAAPSEAELTPLGRIERQEAVVADLLERSTRLDAELTAREDRSGELAAQIATTEAKLVSLDDERSAARTSAEAERAAAESTRPDPAALLEQQLAADPHVQAAREQAALTAARLERHHVAVERVDTLHASVGEARKTERDLASQRDSLHIELDTLRAETNKVLDGGMPLPPVEWQLTDEGVGPIEWYLLGRVASLRSVSAAGSVPLVLNDAFRGLPASEVSTLCGALARIGETVQVIYLGDEPAMAGWAESEGLDRAAVVRPGQPAI